MLELNFLKGRIFYQMIHVYGVLTISINQVANLQNAMAYMVCI